VATVLQLHTVRRQESGCRLANGNSYQAELLYRPSRTSRPRNRGRLGLAVTLPSRSSNREGDYVFELKGNRENAARGRLVLGALISFSRGGADFSILSAIVRAPQSLRSFSPRRPDKPREEQWSFRANDLLPRDLRHIPHHSQVALGWQGRPAPGAHPCQVQASFDRRGTRHRGRRRRPAR
jgi:hypothetical protein